MTFFLPQSVIRLYHYSVLLSGRLFFVFAEDAAGYIEKKREARFYILTGRACFHTFLLH